MTDLLLVAAIVLAALAGHSLLRPRPPRPPAHAPMRTHRPALPPRPAPLLTPTRGAGAARAGPARSTPGRLGVTPSVPAGFVAGPQPRRSSPAADTAFDQASGSRRGPRSDAAGVEAGSTAGLQEVQSDFALDDTGLATPDVPGGEAEGQWRSPLAAAQARRGRGAAVLGAVWRRLPGAAWRERAAKEAAVPEVLDVLRATIVAGAAPYRALLAAAETAPEPLAPALDAAARAAAVGLGPGQALAGTGREQGLVELVVAGEALDLAETTGAPPAPVLAGVAAAATDRLRARQSRMAATAQARLAARVVSGMAPCFLLVLAATSPADAAFLVRERLGWMTLAAATAFEAAGIWWAGRIVGGGP